MGEISRPVKSPQDALVYVEFMARFATDEAVIANFHGIANVIRSLMRKVEEQALQNERLEAKR